MSDAETETATESETVPEAEAETATEPEAEAEAATEPEAQAETATEPDAEAEAETATEDEADEADDEADDEELAEPPPRKRKLNWTPAIIIGAPALALFMVLILPRKVKVIVDNGLQAKLRLQVSGETAEIARGGYLELSVQEGPVRLVATELDPGTNEPIGKRYVLDATVENGFLATKRRTYIWNVEGKTPYYVLMTRGYGDRALEKFPIQKLAPKQHLFMIPEGILPTLNQNFPSTDKVKEKNAVRKALFTASTFSRHGIKQQLKGMLDAKGAAELMKQRPN